MIHLAILTFMGIIDQIDNGLASIEWEDGSQSFLELPHSDSDVSEGARIRVVIHEGAPSKLEEPDHSRSTVEPTRVDLHPAPQAGRTEHGTIRL